MTWNYNFDAVIIQLYTFMVNKHSILTHNFVLHYYRDDDDEEVCNVCNLHMIEKETSLCFTTAVPVLWNLNEICVDTILMWSDAKIQHKAFFLKNIFNNFVT